jgi:tetratricopeptide (TPR) repeat protein
VPDFPGGLKKAYIFFNDYETPINMDLDLTSLKLLPAHALTHNNLGIVLADQGRLTEAVGHFQKALPGFPGAYENLGRVFTTLARYKEAAEANPLSLWTTSPQRQSGRDRSAGEGIHGNSAAMRCWIAAAAARGSGAERIGRPMTI